MPPSCFRAARLALIASLALVAGCFRSYAREEGPGSDAGVLVPCTVPLGSAELILGEERLSMTSWAEAVSYFGPELADINFTAYFEGTSVFVLYPPDECNHSLLPEDYRPIPGRPTPYDLVVRGRAPMDCSDFSSDQRVLVHDFCRGGACPRMDGVECDVDGCVDLPIPEGQLDAFVHGDPEQPTLCARVEARTADGRELTFELNAVLRLCRDCL